MNQLDFDRAFPQTPDCVRAAIEAGFRKGQRKMKLQNKIIALGSIAAAIAIMIAVAAFATGGLGTPPRPDVLAQPPVTDVPKLTEEPMVWCTEKGTYYHTEEHCSGMEGAIYGTLSYALALDKQPCPVCIDTSAIILMPTVVPAPEDNMAVNESTTDSIPETEEYVPVNAKENSQVSTNIVYVEYGADGNSYHRLQNCGSREYLREITESQAKKENFPPCSACYFGYVFYTEGSKYYHSNEHCQGMTNAETHTREDARENHKLPCPICLLVYAREGGTYFHLLPDCMGMLYADLYTQSDAYAMGNQRCPLCLSPETVYATKLGNYFHSDEHCNNMQGAKTTTPETEWANGKTPCPVCITATVETFSTINAPALVPTELPLNSDDQNFFTEESLLYITKNGIYHHYDSDCCGISGAKPYVYEDAKAFNRLSCPVCGSAEEIVYYTTNGKYYHVVEDCSGMKNARIHKAGEATWDNKTPCPACIVPYVYEIEMGVRERTEEEMKRFYPFEGVDLCLDDAVYTELSEKYFHTIEGCSDSPTIEAKTLELAVGRNQLPCPICALGEEDNYRLFKNTFGREPYEVREKRTGFGFFPQPEKGVTCWHLGEFGNVSPALTFYGVHPDYNAERKLQISFSQAESLDFFGSIEAEPIKGMYARAIETAKAQLRAANDSTSSVWVSSINVYFDDAPQPKACEMVFFFEENTDTRIRFDVLESGDWDMTVTPNEMWTTVYAAYGQARYYHKTDVCNGQQNKRKLTLTEAETEQLSPCPDCYVTAAAEKTGVVFYCTPNGKYYHYEPDCSGMQNAEARTPEQAIVNTGKHACPVCFDTEEKKALYMLHAPWGDADEVYVAVDNNYYHIDPNCFNMVMVAKMDLNSAKGFGKTVCPVCIAEQVDTSTLETCWATKNGKYYHSEEHCSGMEHAVSGPVVQAQAMGKLRCPVCIELDLEDYDLFTTAFGQDISDLYYGYNYNHSVGSDWYISNGQESFKLCEVYPEGTAFWDEEPPGIPELHLTGLSADPEQVHIFMKAAPTPIGSMYADAPAEVEKQVKAANGHLNAEEVQQLQNVTVYFDANRQVSNCEMQFGFYDHVKLVWTVGADGQIELTESDFILPGWDNSSKDVNSESQPDSNKAAVVVDASATSAPSIDAHLSFLGTITQIDRLYQSAFGNLEEALALGYGFMPAEDENSYTLSSGNQVALHCRIQDADNRSTPKTKWILDVSLNHTRENSERFMQNIRAFPMTSFYNVAMESAAEHVNEVHTENAAALAPYVDAIRIEFDEAFQIQYCRIQFPCAIHALFVEFQPEEREDGGREWQITTRTEST